MTINGTTNTTKVVSLDSNTLSPFFCSNPTRSSDKIIKSGHSAYQGWGYSESMDEMERRRRKKMRKLGRRFKMEEKENLSCEDCGATFEALEVKISHQKCEHGKGEFQIQDTAQDLLWINV